MPKGVDVSPLFRVAMRFSSALWRRDTVERDAMEPAVAAALVNLASAIACVCVVLLLWVAFVRGRPALQAGGDEGAANEAFMIMSATTIGSLEGKPGMRAGTPACRTVTTKALPSDSRRDKEQMCSSMCATLGGGGVGATYNVSTGYRLAADDKAVQCLCCDPASQVALAVPKDNNGRCLADQTFGIMPGQRAMYVKDGCGGIFQWADGYTVNCPSGPSLREDTVVCPYIDDRLKLTDLQGAEVERRTAITEAEKKRTQDRLDALAAAEQTYMTRINGLADYRRIQKAALEKNAPMRVQAARDGRWLDAH